MPTTSHTDWNIGGGHKWQDSTENWCLGMSQKFRTKKKYSNGLACLFKVTIPRKSRRFLIQCLSILQWSLELLPSNSIHSLTTTFHSFLQVKNAFFELQYQNSDQTKLLTLRLNICRVQPNKETTQVTRLDTVFVRENTKVAADHSVDTNAVNQSLKKRCPRQSRDHLKQLAVCQDDFQK